MKRPYGNWQLALEGAWDDVSYSAGAASRVRGRRRRPSTIRESRALESPSHRRISGQTL